MRIEVSNTNCDDFARREVIVRASEDGNSVAWVLPERLLHSAASSVILDELVAEFRERDFSPRRP